MKGRGAEERSGGEERRRGAEERSGGEGRRRGAEERGKETYCTGGPVRRRIDSTKDK